MRMYEIYIYIYIFCRNTHIPHTNKNLFLHTVSESLLSTSYISTTNNQIVQDTPQQQQRPEEEEEEEEDDEIYNNNNNNNMPRLNKNVFRMNNNNKNNRINVSMIYQLIVKIIDIHYHLHLLILFQNIKARKKGIIVANVINQVPLRNEIQHVQVTIVM